MKSKNSKKMSFFRRETADIGSKPYRPGGAFRLFVSFLCSIGLAALLSILLEGPNLGIVYDMLLRQRPAPVISQEILIIDSTIVSETVQAEDILDPGLLTSVLYTMTELGAGTLIIQVPILELSLQAGAAEEEILHRFDEEFSIISSNIRNLFDGIRTGSVAPRDSEHFVRELVELSERGMERLVYTLVHRDEEGIIRMENAAELFGKAKRPGDLLVQLIRTDGRPAVLAEADGYSRARPDRDGVLRRIAPEITVHDLSENAGERQLEHIVYSALKSMLEATEIDIPRDKDGAILFEMPGVGRDFRRISILDFLAYDEANRNLSRLLMEGETAGIFRNIYGENRPDMIYNYALAVRDEPPETFANGNEEKRLLWVEARNRYFDSLEDFLSGPAEMNLVMAYEEANDIQTRDSIIDLFAALKDGHTELLELRNNLALALGSSFCILGNTQDVEASAFFANSLITGNAITPIEKTHLLLVIFPMAFLVCFFINRRGLFSTLFIGVFLTLLCSAVFCVIFIFSGIWMDPQILAAAGLAAALASFACAIGAKGRYIRHFHLAFGPFVSSTRLKSLIRAGKPLPSETITAKAVLVAIKQTQILAYTGSQDPAKALLIFQEMVSEIFKKADGTIVGIEGDLVIACFGSPLSQTAFDNRALAEKAAKLVSNIALQSEYSSWNFGLDIGNCIFTWTALSGYFAIGTAVQKAKVLARLADRYKTRIVLSATFDENLTADLEVKKLDTLKSRDGTKEEPFYELIVTK